jgi:hypothetical protein
LRGSISECVCIQMMILTKPNHSFVELVLLRLQNIGPFEPLRPRRHTSGHSTLDTITGTISKFNIACLWPLASTFGQPFQNLQDHEYRSLLLAGLVCLSTASLLWNPVQLMQWRSPRTRIRTRWYQKWAQRAAAPLVVLQFTVLYSQRLWQGSFVGHCLLVLLHGFYLVALLTGQQVLDPIELKFSRSVTPSSPPPEALNDENHGTSSRLGVGCHRQNGRYS